MFWLYDAVNLVGLHLNCKTEDGVLEVTPMVKLMKSLDFIPLCRGSGNFTVMWFNLGMPVCTPTKLAELRMGEVFSTVLKIVHF